MDYVADIVGPFLAVGLAFGDVISALLTIGFFLLYGCDSSIESMDPRKEGWRFRRFVCGIWQYFRIG